ncbi:hypothetical protein TNCV_2751971 [Trichonephila clavipes]|nr:hypothetical protein TNCV_2751971 [Trichonephila clavipes]
MGFTWSVAKSPRVAEQCDVNIQSINLRKRRTSNVFFQIKTERRTGQRVTWTTQSELSPHGLLATTPYQRKDVSALDKFNVHRCPTRQFFIGTGLELMAYLP